MHNHRQDQGLDELPAHPGSAAAHSGAPAGLGSPPHWRRRLLTIPAVLLGWVLITLLSPLVLPLLALVGVARRRRFATLRAFAMLWVWLSFELVGLLAAGGLSVWRAAGGLRDEARWLNLHYKLEALWGGGLMRAAIYLFALDVRVSGEDAVPRGPLLLLVRHAGLADTLLAAHLLSSRKGLRLRYVLKAELRLDPCLDIVGHRLPNVFVERAREGEAGRADAAERSDARIRAVADLGRGLGARDGVLLYPEGTRFDAARLGRIRSRLEAAGDTLGLERAMALTHVLPPKVGGVMALLEQAPGADLVFCAHTGLERASRASDLLSGRLVGTRVEVVFWRIAAHEIPLGTEARAEWLHSRWRDVDRWVGERTGG